jgi:hypothetical protein
VSAPASIPGRRTRTTAPGERPRRILVVGATGKLGVAIAKALVVRGDEVALTARHAGKQPFRRGCARWRWSCRRMCG